MAEYTVEGTRKIVLGLMQKGMPKGHVPVRDEHGVIVRYVPKIRRFEPQVKRRTFHESYPAEREEIIDTLALALSITSRSDPIYAALNDAQIYDMHVQNLMEMSDGRLRSVLNAVY